MEDQTEPMARPIAEAGVEGTSYLGDIINTHLPDVIDLANPETRNIYIENVSNDASLSNIEKAKRINEANKKQIGRRQ